MRSYSLAVLVGLFLLAVFMVSDPLAVWFFSPTDSDLSTPTNATVETVATDLRVPWGLAFLPDGDLLVTERPGTLRRIGAENTTFEIPEAVERGEGGLLGIALHPDFSDNRLLYLYHTHRTEDGLRNKIVRYRLDEQLQYNTTIISGIPGAPYHDGGRIAFGPDDKLYVTVGDATKAGLAQNRSTLHGTILRLNPDGTVPGDNPFNTSAYSYGHRNAQGLAWRDGQLWITEHGRSGFKSGLDEINLVRLGRNYGWPVIEGDANQEGMEQPVRHSGPEVTWAPASAEIIEDELFFGGLRGQSLYHATLVNETVTDLHAHYKERFGRIRTVKEGPDGYLYLTTSNRDGRGTPRSGDDKILRVDHDALD